MIPLTQHIENIPAYIFGESSSLASSVCSRGVAESSESPYSLFFQIVVILTAVLYLMWVNKWSLKGANHRKVFAFLGTKRGGYSSKISPLTPSFKSYTYSGIALASMVVWIILLKLLGLSQTPLGLLTESGDLNIVLLLLISLPAMVLYQGLIIGSISYIIDHKEFADEIVRVKGVAAAIFTLTATPTALFYVLSQNNTEITLLQIIGIQLIIATLIYIYETFLLFISKKVSTLHTILYLCAVEILPLTLIWGYFYR